MGLRTICSVLPVRARTLARVTRAVQSLKRNQESKLALSVTDLGARRKVTLEFTHGSVPAMTLSIHTWSYGKEKIRILPFAPITVLIMEASMTAMVQLTTACGTQRVPIVVMVVAMPMVE